MASEAAPAVAEATTPAEEVIPDAVSEGQEAEETQEVAPEGAPEKVLSDVGAEEHKLIHPDTDKLIKFEQDGEQHEVDLQTLKESYLQAEALKGEREEIKSFREQTENVLRRIIEDPITSLLKAYTSIHKDEDVAARELLKHCEKYVAETWKYEQLPESEKKMRALEKERGREREELEKLRAERDQEKKAREEAVEGKRILKEVRDGLTAHGLPETPRMLRMTSEVLLRAREEGHKLSAKDAAEHVKMQLKTAMEEGLKEVQGKPEQFLRLFPDVAEQFRKEGLEAVKKARQTKPAQRSPKEVGEISGQKPRIYRDFEELVNT